MFSEVYRSFFGLASQLWRVQNRSILSSDLIVGIIGRRFICPNDTRWNSKFDATEDLSEQKDKLNLVMDAIQERRFTPDELIFLDEYVFIMGPLAKTLDKLQGNDASIGLVLPAIVSLQKFYKEVVNEGSLKFCVVFAKFILWDLDDRTKHLFKDKDYLLGKLN